MSLPSPRPQPDIPEARQYNHIKRWLEVADLVIGLVFLALLLVTGWNRILRDISVKAGGDHYALRLFIFVLFLSVISKVLGFGLDFYSFRLEHRFNLSNQRLGSWIKDEIKGWVLGLVLATVVAEIIYGLIRTSPTHWWIIAWLVFIAMFVLFAQIAPVVLFPLFYKFVPLQNVELKARLMRLGERAGTKIRAVYEWKLSEKSRKANAALTGLGQTRRIIIADTLLQNYNDD
jgi:STE24 endopeptidase